MDVDQDPTFFFRTKSKNFGLGALEKGSKIFRQVQQRL